MTGVHPHMRIYNSFATEISNPLGPFIPSEGHLGSFSSLYNAVDETISCIRSYLKSHKSDLSETTEADLRAILVKTRQLEIGPVGYHGGMYYEIVETDLDLEQ